MNKEKSIPKEMEINRDIINLLNDEEKIKER
jgi:hypothetical protein